MQVGLHPRGQQIARLAGCSLLFVGSAPLFRNMVSIQRRSFDAALVKHAIDNSMQSIGVCLLMAAVFA